MAVLVYLLSFSTTFYSLTKFSTTLLATRSEFTLPKKLVQLGFNSRFEFAFALTLKSRLCQAKTKSQSLTAASLAKQAALKSQT